MGIFDKVLEEVIDKASDVVNDVVEDVSNGDGVGVAVELATVGILGTTEMGDIVQDQAKVLINGSIDHLQGEEASLGYDDEVIPALVGAGIEDAETAMEIYTAMG
jgi:hypothetical protein